MKQNRASKKLFHQAQALIPGGVNSPVRAFKGVGGTPRFMARAKGAYLWDVDHNKYIDYVGSWGPMLLGHNHPHVLKALSQTQKQGLSFGAPGPLEVAMAQHLCKRIKPLQMVRMVNSGTEAVMGALRLARGYTRKNKILKFAGCYHGHADYLLVKAGSGALTFGSPDSLGVPASFAAETLIAPYNDLATTASLVRQYRDDLAAIIVEPIVGNMGCVLPKPDFLAGLRKLCDEAKALLVFDEVMTGFRVHQSGAAGLFPKVKPDLITLGKVIGGGLPVGAYGGRKEIMQLVSPAGGVYQAGTLSGNPLAMAAGLATLKACNHKSFYQKLLAKTKVLADGLKLAARDAGIKIQTPYACGMLSIYFSDSPIHNLDDAMASNSSAFKKFFHIMLEQGVYLPPSAYESWFVSSAHGPKELKATLTAASLAFKNIALF